MVKKLVFTLCISLLCVACGSEVRRLKESEYLRTEPGKTVVYPEDVDRPAQEKTYVIPELRKAPAQNSTDPELLILPPRLAGVDVSEDPKEKEKPKDKDQEDEGKSLDEGFIETSK